MLIYSRRNILLMILDKILLAVRGGFGVEAAIGAVCGKGAGS